MGVVGAAYAINISEVCGFLYLLVQALRKGYLKIGRPDLPLFRKVWEIGYPVALERIAQQSGQLFYSKFIIGFGTAAYAAHQIGLSIESLSFMPGAGMGIAAATLMGQALGARKINRARLSHRRGACGWRSCYGVHGRAVLLTSRTFSSRLFTHDPEVIEKGCVFLRLVAFAQIPLAISFVYAGSLRGTGDTHYVFWVTLVAMWGIRVLFSYVAIVLASPFPPPCLGGLSDRLVFPRRCLCLALPATGPPRRNHLTSENFGKIKSAGNHKEHGSL